jgi:hypothetical protein
MVGRTARPWRLLPWECKEVYIRLTLVTVLATISPGGVCVRGGRRETGERPWKAAGGDLRGTLRELV